LKAIKTLPRRNDQLCRRSARSVGIIFNTSPLYSRGVQMKGRLCFTSASSVGKH
jgi:hypothetical protein